MPRIDSDACFAQLVGTNRHGYWSIRPAAPIRGINQRYRPDTLILETDVGCESGRVRPIDFMVPPDFEAARLAANCVVRAGDRLGFSLEYFRSHETAPERPLNAEVGLAHPEHYWREWASRCRYRGPFRNSVVRSLITLKALTHGPTGAGAAQ